MVNYCENAALPSRLPSRDQPVRLRAAGGLRRAVVVGLDCARIALDLPADAALAGRAMLSFPSVADEERTLSRFIVAEQRRLLAAR